MPYNIWCGGFGNHIGMGTSIDNRKALKVQRLFSFGLFLSIIYGSCS